MLVIELQYMKADAPIEVTVVGMLTSVREWQWTKAPFSIEVTPSGMITLVSVDRLENAYSPIVVTLAPPIELGMVMQASVPV